MEALACLNLWQGRGWKEWRNYIWTAVGFSGLIVVSIGLELGFISFFGVESKPWFWESRFPITQQDRGTLSELKEGKERICK